MVLVAGPQVCETPLVYLVDTPGVLPPKLADVETGMKLALCGTGPRSWAAWGRLCRES